MSKLFDVKKYKLAKIIVSDLDIVIKVINLSIKGLEPYRVYTPVRSILATLKNEKSVLESHSDKQKTIIKNKGLKSNEK